MDSTGRDDASPDDYDALVLPGGVVNAIHLRVNQDAVRFAQAFVRGYFSHLARAAETGALEIHAYDHPLTVAGQTRGVLYLSRQPGDPPFDKVDMEVISACALQVGLAPRQRPLPGRQLLEDVHESLGREVLLLPVGQAVERSEQVAWLLGQNDPHGWSSRFDTTSRSARCAPSFDA